MVQVRILGRDWEVVRVRAAGAVRERPGLFANAHLGPREVRAVCRLTAGAEAVLGAAMRRLQLSARAYHRILKLARTIADLAGSAVIEPAHVSEAVQYRSLDRAMG